jgi:hypothetical protein
MRNILDAAKFVVLLLLGAICTVCSIICLPAIGLGIVLLTEQVATWSKTSQWHPVPLGALLNNSIYASDVHWSWIERAIKLALSLESGLVLFVAAALTWGLVLIAFDRALKKWRPAARIF